MEVYPPSEDTFLLIEALRVDQARLQGAINAAPIVIEIGCGSGAVLEAISGPDLSLSGLSLFCGTDVNQDATLATRKRCGSTVDVLVTDLLDGLQPGLQRHGGAGLILFNPPYVPTEEDEMEIARAKRNLYASWAGGRNGREVIDRTLPKIPSWLSRFGLMYMILLRENNPTEVIQQLSALGLSSETVRETKAGNEQLSVLRIWHSSQQPTL